MREIDFRNIIIDAGINIFQAMKILDKTGKKILYVTQKGKLVGSLTDGDLRRGIINNVNLHEEIHFVMNKSPKFLTETKDYKKKALKFMESNKIESIPIVDESKNIIDIIFLLEGSRFSKITVEKKANFVFILAGGFGRRMEPFTKILPKPLIPVGDKPIIEIIMDNFLENGFDNFIISTFYKAKMIKAYFSSSKKYQNIKFVEEKKPLGTIGSLFLVKDKIKDTFFITNSDIYLHTDLTKILDFHKNSRNSVTVVGCLKKIVIPYGILKTEENNFLSEIQEKPNLNFMVNTGFYVAEPEILELLEGNTKKDMDVLLKELIQNNKKISVYPVSENSWLDTGVWEEYLKSEKFFQMKFWNK